MTRPGSPPQQDRSPEDDDSNLGLLWQQLQAQQPANSPQQHHQYPHAQVWSTEQSFGDPTGSDQHGDWARPIPVQNDYRLRNPRPQTATARNTTPPIYDAPTGQWVQQGAPHYNAYAQAGSAPYTPQQPAQRSWWEAYRAYRTNPDEGHKAVMFGKLCAAALGINVMDDAIPLLGQLDDVFAPGQFAGLAVFGLFVARRVKRYR